MLSGFDAAAAAFVGAVLGATLTAGYLLRQKPAGTKPICQAAEAAVCKVLGHPHDQIKAGTQPELPQRKADPFSTAPREECVLSWAWLYALYGVQDQKHLYSSRLAGFQ